MIKIRILTTCTKIDRHRKQTPQIFHWYAHFTCKSKKVSKLSGSDKKSIWILLLVGTIPSFKILLVGTVLTFDIFLVGITSQVSFGQIVIYTLRNKNGCSISATSLPSDFGNWHGMVWWYKLDLLPCNFQTHSLENNCLNLVLALFLWTDRVTYTIRYPIKSAMLCHIWVKCWRTGKMYNLWP